MAENTIDIAGASQDLQTIEDFVNLPAGSDVRPRLLPSVNVGTLAGTRDAIFRAGGLPATPFATKALMTASALVDGDYAMVTDDTVNNGLYVKTAGAWVKSGYDPLEQAKAYADSLTVTIENLIPEGTIETGKAVVGGTGAISINADYESTGFIPVSSGDKIMYKGKTSGSIGVAAYDGSKVYVKRIYDWGTDGDLPDDTLVFTITDPSVKFIRASTKISFNVPLQIARITEISQQVNVNKNDIEALKIKPAPPLSYTLDLLDGVDILNGTAINGETGASFANAGYNATPLLPVDLGLTVNFTGSFIGQTGIAAYNSTGIFVESVFVPIVDGAVNGAHTFTITNPLVKYIRACNRIADGIPMTIKSDITYTGEKIHESLQGIRESIGSATFAADIVVEFVDNTKFIVKSLAPDGSYVSHIWVYAERPEFAEKGWYSTEILHNGDYIVQGNYNTIHIMLDGGTVDDALFVGMGHGCETMLYCQFYLDGQEFDPTTATGTISGKQFKVQSLSDKYKPDRELTIQTLGNTQSTMPAQPLEIRSKRIAEMTISSNNRIVRHQKLVILKDNVKFNCLYGAMQRTIQPFINGTVTLNDKDGIRNYFPVDDTPEPLAPSTVKLNSPVGYGDKNCFATRFTANGVSKGYAYNVETWCANSDSSKIDKNHIQVALMQTGSNKVYFVPVLTTMLQTKYPDVIADVFNIGDVIEMESTTEINVSKI